MSFRKKLKKLVRKIAPKVTQGLWNPGQKAEERKAEAADAAFESGLRGAAAKRLVDQSKQAGAGQIKYQTEEDVI